MKVSFQLWRICSGSKFGKKITLDMNYICSIIATQDCNCESKVIDVCDKGRKEKMILIRRDNGQRSFTELEMSI